jgi:hypothetical protein
MIRGYAPVKGMCADQETITKRGLRGFLLLMDIPRLCRKF